MTTESRTKLRVHITTNQIYTNRNPSRKCLLLRAVTACSSKHSTKYSHMSYASKEIHTRNCYCTVFSVVIVTVSLVSDWRFFATAVVRNNCQSGDRANKTKREKQPKTGGDDPPLPTILLYPSSKLSTAGSRAGYRCKNLECPA